MPRSHLFLQPQSFQTLARRQVNPRPRQDHRHEPLMHRLRLVLPHQHRLTFHLLLQPMHKIDAQPKEPKTETKRFRPKRLPHPSPISMQDHRPHPTQHTKTTLDSNHTTSELRCYR